MYHISKCILNFEQGTKTTFLMEGEDIPVQGDVTAPHTPLLHVLLGLPVQHGALQVYVTVVPGA